MKISNKKTANSSISTTPLRFDNSSLTKTFVDLEIIYIVRN